VTEAADDLQVAPLPIPTVDLADLADGADPARRLEALAALRRGFGELGLVYVRGHGVGPMAGLYDRFVDFTARPAAEKEVYNRKDLYYQRGWTPPNTEQAVVAGGQPDFKECWFATPTPMPPELQVQFPEVYADNVWPEGDPVFPEICQARGAELHRVGLALVRGAAEALGLPADALAALCEGGPHIFRLLRYLPLTTEQVEQKVLWGEEHTDFNLLTLLPGGRFHDPEGRVASPPSARSGLYLRTRGTPAHPSGRMVRGTAPEGCIVAQVGQQLEMLTGGAFLATPHVITAPDQPGWSRLSAAHFVHVHAHTTLFPLPPFRTPETERAYSPPVLAGTYGLKTLVDIGLAPASALASLGYRHYDRLAKLRER